MAKIFLAGKNGTSTKHRTLTDPLMTELDKDEQFYRDTESIAFPKLDDRQLAMLEPLGARRIVRRGELVYKAGQRDLGLTVILGGELEVLESRDGQEQILGTSGPRGFIGDVAMLMGTAAVANARGKADESEIRQCRGEHRGYEEGAGRNSAGNRYLQ